MRVYRLTLGVLRNIFKFLVPMNSKRQLKL